MTALATNPVTYYKMTGQSDMLVKEHSGFLTKYLTMFITGNIELKSYEMRYFLSLHMANSTLAGEIRKKHPSSEAVAEASRVLHFIRSKLKGYDKHDIFHELLIPMLQMALDYREVGSSFEGYLKSSYKFKLYHHLKDMPLDTFNRVEMNYLGLLSEVDEESFAKGELDIESAELHRLTHPSWVHGLKAEAPFDQFEPHERYIMMKYYHEEKTDKEIARMLPYHPKSINRIRMRCIDKIIEQQSKGELKCLRFVKCQLLQ